MPQAERDEAVAGVGHERHSRVAHPRDIRALLQSYDQLWCARQFIVFVVADERLMNVVASKEFQSMASILAGDLIDFLQDAQRPQRDVLQIADRGADKIEAPAGYRTHHVYRFGRSSLCAHAHESSTRSASATRARAREQCYTFSFEHHLGGASVPLYEYKCLKCGRNTEKIENVSGPHLKKCPHCGGKVESVITAPSIQFKGAGWYVTDYGGKKASGDGDKADQPATETKEAGNKEKDSASRESTSKEAASKGAKEGKEKKSAKKK